mmetsp:Transcript_75706/g.225696  ORF Transcript_75706/g.225696 Transcript_75706/m.225696 type:complete len:440 (-) Transcript_75706:168-1487(-)
MAQSPRYDARNRYQSNFNSTIFAPPNLGEAARTQFVPAGKRRDQTTTEMFGNYEEKDLKAMPKTFVPKDDRSTPHEMKMHFLKSEVLPCSNYPAQAPGPSHRAERWAAEAAMMDPNNEENVDAKMKRQEELSSKLFGRQTPGVDTEQLHSRNSRLAPNDFKWHSYPEPIRSPRQDAMHHAHRAYQEKCSTVFDHRSPEVPQDLVERRLAREEEDGSELQRRSNAHYSDLFGRGAYATSPRGPPFPDQDGKVRRPRAQANPADQIAVQQDWMDSKTEFLSGPYSTRPEHPAHRKSEELHHSRVFPDQENSYQPPERIDALTHDNSNKLRTALGRTTQEIHQAHMRTSVAPNQFYETAESTKQWEVVELHVSGLPADTDKDQLKSLCQGFDLQVVKADVEMDPVRNMCRGRGKIMVRHNAQQASVVNLVRKLEQSKLRVEV